MKTLSIIGCGQVGRTLAKLWHESKVFKIQEILNRSILSATEAVSFIGAGKVISNLKDTKAVDVLMIGTSDSNILECANSISKLCDIKQGTIVFHCSGALSSFELRALKDKGAFVCSAHPVKSFSGEESYTSFSGTHIALEGDMEATEVLSSAFNAIGGLPFIIPPESKVLYHSALSMVSNYLPSLLDVGINILAQTGMSKVEALNLIEPLVRGTVDNVFSLGTVKALTGPISRGDAGVVSAHLKALQDFDRESESKVLEIYTLLGRVALELARKQDKVGDALLYEVGEVLAKAPIET